MEKINKILDSIFSISPELKEKILAKWETSPDDRKKELLNYLNKLKTAEEKILRQCAKNNPGLIGSLNNIEAIYRKDALKQIEKTDTLSEEEKAEEILKQI